MTGPVSQTESRLLVEGDRIVAAAPTGLDEASKQYASAARAENTILAYGSDWAEWTSWTQDNNHETLPASPVALCGYLSALADAGASVSTMSRRLAAIRFVHRGRDLPDPTADSQVIAVWEGIRRTHGQPPEQADPLMPPDLNTVLEHCPTTRSWKSQRADEPHYGGLRDRALLTVGFFAALRRSEIAALRLENITEHDHGLVIELPRSKTNQDGGHHELMVLPRTVDQLLCPVTNLTNWIEAANIQNGPIFRQVTRHNRIQGPIAARAVNDILQVATRRSGIAGHYSAHSLRAGFATFANLRGASDRAIAHQTRHASLASLDQYIRFNEAWTENAATQLGL